MKHLILVAVFAATLQATPVFATTTASTSTASDTLAIAGTTTATQLTTQREAVRTQANDTTQPEKESAQAAIFEQLERRIIDEPNLFNFFAYWVQQAIFDGIPANTVFLILLAPILALFISFTRVVIGLPTLDMLVPIALAFAFVSIGVGVGLFILAAIVAASYIAKVLVSRVRMMFYPKRSLSLLILSLFVFGALTAALQFEYTQVLTLSIFPILILMLIGDSIVSVQLHKSLHETVTITATTLTLGLLGYVMATNSAMQSTLILFPELVLLVVPFNILIGRYFGLRVTEVFRFKEFVND